MRWLTVLATLAFVAPPALRPHAGVPPSQQEPSTAELVARATTYVNQYRSALAFLIADEEYVQVVSNGIGEEQQRRTLRGELLLTFLEVDKEWVAVHDFATMGGKPVAERTDLQKLLSQGTTSSVIRQVAAQNARFNIGTIDRDFNEPTLPLLIFDARRVANFTFQRRGGTKDGTATLEFLERGQPTIVGGTQSSPLYSRGEIVMDVSTGRVLRTRMEFRDDFSRAELSTVYSRDEKLDLHVPSLFKERYERTANGEREVIACEAKYTNHRRFAATGRIRR